jgi:hypothetical protein
MKKILSIILIPVFLLTATVGMSYTAYFCKGKMDKGISLKPCCKDVKKGGCCEKETKLLKVKDDFVQTAYYFNLNGHFFIDITSFNFSYPYKFSQASVLKHYGDKAPPSENIPFTILYQSFLI